MQADRLSSADQRFTASAARLLTAWCLFWLAFFGNQYLSLTWQLCSELQGLPWVLGISPCFWLWLSAFAAVVWVLERLIRITRHRFERQLNLNKAAFFIAAMPLALWLCFNQLFPYLYPADSGVVRLVPFIGGRGF
jgi:TRAP-type C4-dicarboxylate transport system permease small subunit